MTRLKSGDRDALVTLYNDLYLPLYRYGMKLTSDSQLCRDSINQIMLRIWESRNQLAEVANFRSYIFTAMRNEIIAEHRSQETRKHRHESLARLSDSVERSYEERIISEQQNLATKEKIRRAFAELTLRQKELLELRFYDNLSYTEIADKCGITKRTAYNIINEGLKILKKNLYSDRSGNQTLIRVASFTQPLIFLFQFLSFQSVAEAKNISSILMVKKLQRSFL